MIITRLIQTLFCLLEQEKVVICNVIRVSLFRHSLCNDIGNLQCSKMLGDFNIANNLFIITKTFCSDTVAGIGENESMTRVKEHPSYIKVGYEVVYISRTCYPDEVS